MPQGSLVTNYTPRKLTDIACWIFNDSCLRNNVPRNQDRTNIPVKNGNS